MFAMLYISFNNNINNTLRAFLDKTDTQMLKRKRAKGVGNFLNHFYQHSMKLTVEYLLSKVGCHGNS